MTESFRFYHDKLNKWWSLKYKPELRLMTKRFELFYPTIDQDNILEILQEGGRRAREVAEAKLDDIREKVGVKLY